MTVYIITISFYIFSDLPFNKHPTIYFNTAQSTNIVIKQTIKINTHIITEDTNYLHTIYMYVCACVYIYI
jgi:hypothetical protein